MPILRQEEVGTENQHASGAVRSFMAPKKPSHGKLRTGDEVGIAVLTLCLGHSACFPIVTSVLPEFRAVIPHAESLSCLLAIVACFLSIVVLLTGCCHHRQRLVLAKCGIGSGLLIIAICSLSDCRCIATSTSTDTGFHSILFTAVLPSVACVILISAHFRNQRLMRSLLQRPQHSQRRRA